MPRWSRKAKRTETGAIRKKWKGRARIALVFPNRYEVGMANLGFQRVYAILNSFDEIVCERLFWDGVAGTTPSVESNRPLRDFDIACFSISFELDYLKIPVILESQGISCWSLERQDRHPLVFAGGIAPSLNPEPIAPFIDALFTGEFEAVATDFAAMVPTLVDPDLARETRLEMLVERVEGVYCPMLFDLVDGFHRGESVVPPICRHVDVAPMSQVLTSESIFGHMHLVETARGCGQGCRFCAAGFSYRPPRRWPRDAVLSAMGYAREKGAGTIGLIGLEFIDQALLNDFMDFIEEEGLRLSFSSLRADKVTPRFAALLWRSGAKTATIAAEAGSERLRRVINKRLGEEEILAAATTLLHAGVMNLKVYFMLGLPTEEESDLEAAIDLIKKIRDAMLRCGRRRGRLGTLTASFSTFVPKPFTPFELVAQAPIQVLKRRRSILRRGLQGLSNVRLQLDSLREARSQAILSRGDRDLAPAIRLAAVKGMSLEKAVKESGLRVDRYLTNMVENGVARPWECISPRVSKAYLKEEYQKALAQQETGECIFKGCKRCGACGSV